MKLLEIETWYYTPVNLFERHGTIIRPVNMFEIIEAWNMFEIDA